MLVEDVEVEFEVGEHLACFPHARDDVRGIGADFFQEDDQGSYVGHEVEEAVEGLLLKRHFKPQMSYSPERLLDCFDGNAFGRFEVSDIGS